MNEYDDAPTQKRRTDTYELTSTEVIIESGEGSDDLIFSEVVDVFKDNDSGLYFPKYCAINFIKFHSDDDQEFEYISKRPQFIDISKYIGGKQRHVVLYIEPKFNS